MAFFFNYLLQPFAFLFYLAGFVIHRHYRRDDNTHALYTYYILASVLHMTIATCAAYRLTSKGNIWLYDIGGFLAVLFISRHFYQLLDSKLKKRTVIVLTIINLLYAVVRQFTIEGVRLFDSIGTSFFSASVAVYVFMYFHQVLKNVTEANILKDFNFWLCSSYLLYFVGSFIIFINYHRLTTKILKTYTQEERDLLMALWGVHNVLLFAGALLLLTGSLWISYRRKLA